jgi:hypothetical protein
MIEFTCDICGAPMELEKKFKNHKTPSMNYRRRRFKCTICDFQKTIFADGEMDEKFIPDAGIEIVKRRFKQEEINRDNGPTGHGDICYSDADPGL